MSGMSRRRAPDVRTQAVVDAFVKLSAREKAAMILLVPDLFFSVAKLVRCYDTR